MRIDDLVDRVALGDVGIVVVLVERRAAAALLTNLIRPQGERLASSDDAEIPSFRHGRKPMFGIGSASRTRP